MLTGVLLKGSFNNFLMFSPSEMTSTSGITSTKSLASLKEEKPVCKGLEEENPLVFRPSLSQFFGGFLNKNLDTYVVCSLFLNQTLNYAMESVVLVESNSRNKEEINTIKNLSL